LRELIGSFLLGSRQGGQFGLETGVLRGEFLRGLVIVEGGAPPAVRLAAPNCE